MGNNIGRLLPSSKPKHLIQLCQQKNFPSIGLTAESHDYKDKATIPLIWLDKNLDVATKDKLQELSNDVLYYTRPEPCIQHILSTERASRIFLVISGSYANEMLSQISRNVNAIFIYCFNPSKYEPLLEKYPRLVGIYTHLKELVKSIREKMHTVIERSSQVFSCYELKQKSIRDLSKESLSFLFFQLAKGILLKLPRTDDSKQKMLNECRFHYQDNEEELALINEFEKNYTAADAIHWYTKQCFIYKLVNKALRTEDIEQLYTYRFYITDLSTALTREYEEFKRQNHIDSIKVYRGVIFCSGELENLQENVGNLISMNGFLSTSLSRDIALSFILDTSSKSKDSVSVLLEIAIDFRLETVIFADVSKYSLFPEEEEILFDLDASFEISTVKQEKDIWTVYLKATDRGGDVAFKYIIGNDITETFLLLGKLVGGMGKYTAQSNEVPFMILDGIRHLHGIASVFFEEKGDYDKALEFYMEALKMEEKSLPPSHPEIGHSLHNIGLCYYKKYYYTQALEYQMRALHIRGENFDNLQMIGLIYYKQGNWEKALEFMNEALKFPNRNMSSVLNTMGVIYHKKGDLISAMKYYQHADARKNMAGIYFSQGDYDKAIEIFKDSDHPNDIHNRGLIYYRLGELEKALSCFIKALDLMPNEATILVSIGNVYKEKGKNKNALDYYQRAIEIQENSKSWEIVQTFNNIGLIYYTQKEYNFAMNYFMKALDLVDLTEIIDKAHILNNMAMIHYQQYELETSISYLKRALIIYKKILPLNHSFIKRTLYNIEIACEKQTLMGYTVL